MSNHAIQAAPPGEGATKTQLSREEFKALTARPTVEGFLDEPEILHRVPISRRTLGDWKSKGVIPFIRIGRRCLYDWESVRSALLRKQK